MISILDIEWAFRLAYLQFGDKLGVGVQAIFFASFRAMLGDELYEMVQMREDQAQSELLASLLSRESNWEVFVTEVANTVVGFVAVQLNQAAQVGEIGLNAVHPEWAGQGIGTAMYQFALSRMKEAGMRAATVATGADASHAPARRAYQKAGFAAQISSVWMCRRLYLVVPMLTPNKASQRTPRSGAAESRRYAL